MKIYIASDHAGFELKKALIGYLRAKKMDVVDMGAFKLDIADDYPDFIYPCVKKVSEDIDSVGIVIGGSGQGEAMVANKVKGVRAAVFYGGKLDLVKFAKQHNNANILSFGARFMTVDEAKAAVDLWLSTKFEGGRHVTRLAKITKIENGEAHIDPSIKDQS